MGRSLPIRAFGGAWFDARLCDAASGGLCAADAGRYPQFPPAEQPVRGASREFRARRRRDDDGAAGAGARDGGRDGDRRAASERGLWRRSCRSSHICHRGRWVDRKSVVGGKSVWVGVDLGGRRIIKKKK